MKRYTYSFYLNDDCMGKALVDEQGLCFAYTFGEKRSRRLEN